MTWSLWRGDQGHCALDTEPSPHDGPAMMRVRQTLDAACRARHMSMEQIEGKRYYLVAWLANNVLLNIGVMPPLLFLFGLLGVPTAFAIRVVASGRRNAVVRREIETVAAQPREVVPLMPRGCAAPTPS